MTGYRVLIGSVSGQPTSLVDVGAATSAVVSALMPGQTYYFTVTAYNNVGLESPPSGEVSYTVPGISPVPSPVPSPTPAPTAIPTATPIPTASPIPTATPVPTPIQTATPIPTATFQLTIDKNQVNVGQTVQVTLNDSFLGVSDQIALYAAGGSSPIDFFYLNGSKTPPVWGINSATVAFVMPTAGQFEFRFLSGSRAFATSPQVTVIGPTPTPTATPSLTSLLNVSTRAYVQTGENVLIGGLIIAGDLPKKVVLRAIGPSLIAAGLSNALRDPMITLYDSTGAEIASNNNWRTNATAVQATGLAPTNDAEAAIVTTLAPGAYTAIISGVGGTKGIALFELYDLATATSRISNIATRGKVEAGDNIMIGGFILGGAQPSRVVIRALGPSLAAGGIAGSLADPSLELYNGNGSQIFTNDNWRSSQEQQLIASSLAPTDDRESAIIATLQPGNYTAIVRGVGNATGVGLVEVYNISN